MKLSSLILYLAMLKLFRKDLYCDEDVTVLVYNPKKLGDIFHYVSSCSAIKI